VYVHGVLICYWTSMVHVLDQCHNYYNTTLYRIRFINYMYWVYLTTSEYVPGIILPTSPPYN